MLTGMGAEAVRSQLERALHDRGMAGRVEGLSRLSGGASRDTWSFALVDDGHRTELILQRSRPGGIRTGVGMAGEAELVRAAAEAGVPVPTVLAWSDHADELAQAWAVTEHIAGETIPRRVLRSLADDEVGARRLTRELGRAAAAIGRIDPARVPHLHQEDQVDQFRELLDGFGQPSPAFELGLRWLEEHRPDPVEARVVHGDLRLGNLIVGEGGLRAVIDWELAHLGDPVEDLAWPCVRAWRFGGAGAVGGFGDREALYLAYEAASGRTVDRARARWWEVLSTLKWGVMCIIQARTHLDGLNRSVELATIGRRVCENEYDLLRLTHPHLDPGPAPATDPRPPRPETGLHGRPTAAELVEAVEEYLREDVLATTEGQVRFHARVAANALAVVARELVAGPGAERDHAERLASLGVEDEAGLARAIRSGRWAGEEAELEGAVWASVLAKLAVANPAYAEGAGAGAGS